MKKLFCTAAIACLATGFLLLLATPAQAQMSPMGGSGMNGGGGVGAPGGVQPKVRVPDIAPPALPGAGMTPLATGPVMAKPITGDPTLALFAAVNKADYNAAQDAISRGADLNAQNPLGETPLDLAVSLNRSTITFLLLSARNESGDGAPPPPAAGPGLSPRMAHHKTLKITPAAERAPIHMQMPTVGTNPGTPDASAGFLGFQTKN
jgi:hypothetical protein